MMGLPEGSKSFKIGLVVLIQYRLWQTATQPASQPRCRSYYALCSASSPTRSSADANKPARRVWKSVMVTKHSTIVYYCAIVTLSLRRAVFTIFDFKKSRDLEMGSKVTQGHWEYHSIDCIWFPISVFCNFVPKMHRFWDIRLKNAVTLKTGLGVRQGHWNVTMW